jgi:prevent-host-death family protein
MSMSEKLVGSAGFKANCLKILDQMGKDKQPVTITKRGNPVARLSPIEGVKGKGPIIGAMKGSILCYDDPLAPATDVPDWKAAR